MIACVVFPINLAILLVKASTAVGALHSMKSHPAQSSADAGRGFPVRPGGVQSWSSSLWRLDVDDQNTQNNCSPQSRASNTFMKQTNEPANSQKFRVQRNNNSHTNNMKWNILLFAWNNGHGGSIIVALKTLNTGTLPPVFLLLGGAPFLFKHNA